MGRLALNEKCKMKNETFFTLSARGFSLIELLAVLLLLSLASFIVLPAVDKKLRELEVRQSALQLAAVARGMRSRAIDENALQRLVFSPQQNSYHAWNRQIFLSPDISITDIAGGEPVGERRQFLFFPNGSVLGGEITISAGEGSSTYSVRLDSLTGRVVVGRGGRE